MKPRLPIQTTRPSIALLGAAAALLAGCSNAPFPPEIEGETITVRAIGEDPKTLDPSVSYTASEAPITSLINPAFYRYDFFKQKRFELQPNLGVAPPTLEKLPGGGERWTYRIRHDLRYQDDPAFAGGKGRAITAADFVYAFQRMADPAVECPVSSFVADKIVGWAEDVKGFETAKGAQYDRPMHGVRVDPNDPYAFTIELSQPYPQLRFLMAMGFTAPQAREAVEKYGDAYGLRHPVGCGPYLLKEYVSHDHIYLERNPNAPRELFSSEFDPEFADVRDEANKPVGLLKGIYMPIIKEAVTNYNLFQQGYLDTLGVGASNATIVPAANGLTQEMKDRGIKLNKNVGITINYLAFNMKDPVFGGYTEKQRKLRQAISLAVDSQSYIDIITQGMDVPAEWIIPPGLPGYDPTYKNPYGRFDPKLTKAKQLLAEAGYKDGIDPSTRQPLVLNYDNYATSAELKQITRLYQKQIQALGLKVNLRQTTYANFQERLNKRQGQFFNFGWIADYPDAENFAFLLYGPNAAPGPNASLYDNPEYNKLFEQMRAMTDGPERNAIIKKMRDISVEDCPWIYSTHTATRTLVQPWVENNYASPIANDLLKYVRIDPKKRTGLQAQWNRSVLWPIGAFLAAIVLVCIPASATIKNRTNRRVRKDGAAS